MVGPGFFWGVFWEENFNFPFWVGVYEIGVICADCEWNFILVKFLGKLLKFFDLFNTLGGEVYGGTDFQTGLGGGEDVEQFGLFLEGSFS